MKRPGDPEISTWSISSALETFVDWIFATVISTRASDPTYWNWINILRMLLIERVVEMCGLPARLGGRDVPGDAYFLRRSYQGSHIRAYLSHAGKGWNPRTTSYFLIYDFLISYWAKVFFCTVFSKECKHIYWLSFNRFRVAELSTRDRFSLRVVLQRIDFCIICIFH